MNRKLRNVFLIIVILCLLPTSQVLANQYKLVFAVDLIRHGDRTPTISVPNDNYHWKEGLGELTAKGMAQLFSTGKSFREFYISQTGLLNKTYRAEDIYIRSSDINRTLMSAQALLLGLYPLGTGPSNNQNQFALPQGFQPIPIHTTAANNDEIFLPSHIHCEEYKNILNKYVYSQAYWIDKEKEFQSKFLIWSQKTGYAIKHLQDITCLGDMLYVRQEHGIDPPTSLSKEEAQEIINLHHWVMVNKYKSPQVGKFIASGLINDLKNNLAKINTNSEIKPKYIIYSGHDTNILGLMSALGVPLETIPSYGGDLRFEVLADEQNRYWVKTSYNQNLQKLPGCTQLCSLKQFLELINT